MAKKMATILNSIVTNIISCSNEAKETPTQKEVASNTRIGSIYEDGKYYNMKEIASDISDNRDGIMETFENSMLNSDDISVLREGLEEVYELLLESEE